MLEVLSARLPAWLLPGGSASLIRALVIVFGGLVLSWALSRLVSRVLRRAATPERAVFGRRVTFYVLLGLAVASALSELGFDLTVLLGAAGILTVALGFASQTSASNVISGIFLIAERPFSVGDWIRMAEVEGEVVGIDFLSVKVRTFDNLFVRVPNETMMKSSITNVTRFPIRRIDLLVSIAYHEDQRRVREVLVALADDNPMVLDEPRPRVHFVGYGPSSIDLKFCVWTARENYLDVKSEVAAEIKARFDAEGIEIPFPQLTLHHATGAAPT